MGRFTIDGELLMVAEVPEVVVGVVAEVAVMWV